MTQTYQRIMDAIVDSPVVDTHDHLRPPAHLERPISVSALLRNSYVARALRVADGSPNGIVHQSARQRGDSWEATRDIVEKVKFTSYYRWLLRGLIELYELPQAELTAEAWEQLNTDLPVHYADPTWPGEVLDRAHVEMVIWDPFWKPGTWQGHDSRLMPSLRISSAVVGFHPEANDYEGCNVIRDWSGHFDINVASLTDLELLIERLLAQNVQAGCRSLKCPIAYDRTLSVGPGTRKVAERVFGKAPSVVSEEERVAFGDYVVHFLLELARSHGLVFQVHTGLARLSGSNPMLLMPLIEQYPDVVFDLFHGGYPWIHEVGALAQNYPNVRLNLTWLPQLSTEAAVLALKEWLQVVPQSDRISWGADCQTVEEAYGALAGAKHVIGRALAELVEEGYLSFDDALEAAASVLHRGGRAIYGHA